MPTGTGAAEAARKRDPKPKPQDDDRGPGSIAGNLTHDPEIRYTSAGKAVSSLRVACSERVRDPKTGQWKDGEAAFYTVTCWGQLAENVGNVLQKGDRIVAEGRWTVQRWENPDGEAQERVVLTARDLGPSMIWREARPERKGAS